MCIMASSVETKICFGTVKRAKPFWASSLPAVIVTLIGLSPASLKMSPTARPTPVSSITSSVVKHREMMSVGNAAVLPGSETTVGGYSAADLIVIDEAARVKDSIVAGRASDAGNKSGSPGCLDDPCRQARLVLRSMDRRQPVVSREGAGLDVSAHLTGIGLPLVRHDRLRVWSSIVCSGCPKTLGVRNIIW